VSTVWIRKTERYGILDTESLHPQVGRKEGAHKSQASVCLGN